MSAPAEHAEGLESELGEELRAEPVNSPGHDTIPVDARSGAESKSGSSFALAWGSRSDVGLVRSHNEDSFLVQPPAFAVCDGMGGHAAGEVASSIAAATIGESVPVHADDVLLGVAVEAANAAVIEGAAAGKGKAGMGCTASCVLIEESKMAIAHVGDSRIYLLHSGTLVRLTHDHSYVEELVDAGEITADEARVHPSRSIITRALGSDPDMYADHFTLDVSDGDRIIICSDGLSSMVEDSEMEAISCSSASPQAAADNLVAAALAGGGSDNVTVVVVDILDDGTLARHRRAWHGRIMRGSFATLIALALLALGAFAFIKGSWYLADNNGTVGIYQGVDGQILGFPLSRLVETTSVRLTDLPNAVRQSLVQGMRMSGEDEAHRTVESYRDQIDANKSAAAVTAGRTATGTDVSPEKPAAPEAKAEGAGE